MNEIWKDIKGYEGKYQISNMGRIKSLSREHAICVFNKVNIKIFSKDRIIKGHKDKDGYLMVSLPFEGRYKNFKIHRLVAFAFLDKIEGKNIINHKNGKKDDNRVENLEWCTNSENLYHAHHVLYGDTHKYYNERPIKRIDTNGRVTIYKNSTIAANEMGVTKSSICSCLKGKSKTCKKCKLEYVIL